MRTGRLLIPLTAAALILGGCGNADENQDIQACEVADVVVLVVAAHANAPAPNLTAADHCTAQAGIEGGTQFSLIAVDGTPSIVMEDVVFPVTSANAAAHADDVANAVAALDQTVATVQADSDGADLYAAIAMGADKVRSSGLAGELRVIGPGTSDTGVLNVTAPGVLSADPEEYADFLSTTGQLADLSGVQRIVLESVGYTAPPQADLDPADRERLTDLLTAVLTRSGAPSVTADPVPRSNAGPSTSFTTGLIEPMARPVFVPGDELLFGADGPITFHADTAELIDPVAAEQAVADVRAWLDEDPSRQATVTGTTAAVGDDAGRLALSRSRAAVVADLIATDNVTMSQLTVIGLGSDFPEYQPDQRPDGSLDPVAAAANRTVRIATSANP